jgi:hypothetical protein
MPPISRHAAAPKRSSRLDASWRSSCWPGRLASLPSGDAGPARGELREKVGCTDARVARLRVDHRRGIDEPRPTPTPRADGRRRAHLRC